MSPLPQQRLRVVILIAALISTVGCATVTPRFTEHDWFVYCFGGQPMESRVHAARRVMQAQRVWHQVPAQPVSGGCTAAGAPLWEIARRDGCTTEDGVQACFMMGEWLVGLRRPWVDPAATDGLRADLAVCQACVDVETGLPRASP